MQQEVPKLKKDDNLLSSNEKKSKKRKIIFLVTMLIVLAIISFVVFKFYKSRSSSLVMQAPSSEKFVSESKSFPFEEMTIPYLKARDYTSSLEKLVQNSSNGSYTSYLTSYDSDGLKVNGLLTIPSGKTPDGGWPAIVFVHGYIPPSTYRTVSNYTAYVDYLAKNGFVVFKIDLRGHDKSEGVAGGGYYSGDYIIDTLNARAALMNADFVNAKKIGLWGHSMAGNVVSRALAARADIPAIVIWAGAVYTYSDFSQFRISDNSYRPPSDQSLARKKRDELFEMYGAFDPKSEFWKLVPMTNYLSDIKGAIQLNHAVDDDVVSIDYSRNFNKILDSTQIKHELNEYSGGGHNINNSFFNTAMQNTVRFFKDNL